MNPLLQSNPLPLFSKIQPEHIEPAIRELIAGVKTAVEQVVGQADGFTWSTLVSPIEQAQERLSEAFSPVGHMKAVIDSPALRDAYNACLPLLSELGTWLGQHQALYQAYKSLASSAEFDDLSTAQQKVIRDAVRDFELAGVGLQGTDRKRYGEIRARLSDLSSGFSDALLDASQAWSKHITDGAELAGIPETALGMMQGLAEAKGLEGYLVTLDAPVMMAVMSFAERRELRAEVHKAWSTRASDQGPNAGQFDNSERIDETLALRHEMAQLLGFDSYAEFSLATKMANETGQVLGFLQDLADKAKPFAEQEVATLKAFARDQGQPELAAWDYGYYSERLKEQTFEIDQEALRPWFPLPKVLQGLFAVTGELFDFTVSQVESADLWHPEASFWQIQRAGKPVGYFYLDLYAREGKRGGAWMDVCRSRWQEGDTLHLPVAYLTCNFSRPVGQQPALLTHDEVVTLFHEFGHGLHHMMTAQDTLAVSGIAGVPWDAVELPSQFLENWCYASEGLALMSGHYETGQALPQAELDKLIAARSFQAGMQTLRQVEFALFDFQLHAHYDPINPTPFMQVLQGVRDRVAVVPAPDYGRFPCSFGHIFAGGYAAGYYSYKWAEVLSADAFSRFEEEGIMNPATGQAFRAAILERGGSEDPMTLFVEFRGREPQVDALLRHNGLAA